MNKKLKTKIDPRSIYAQLGDRYPEQMQIKADLAIEINKAIKNKKFTQTKAAKILGISQPELSELLRGRFREYSIKRLIHFLNELGRDVSIVVGSKPRKARFSEEVKTPEKPLGEFLFESPFSKFDLDIERDSS